MCVLRSNSGVPTQRSSAWMRLLNAGCVTFLSWAAREKFWCSASTRKSRSHVVSIEGTVPAVRVRGLGNIRRGTLGHMQDLAHRPFADCDPDLADAVDPPGDDIARLD